MRKLTDKEVTKAVNVFARKYGYYVRTVRGNTELKRRAFAEFFEKEEKEKD